MKKKVAIFFHLEEPNEKAAYELLESLGRKKSAVIVKLFNSHKDEILGYKGEKRKQIATASPVSVVEEATKPQSEEPRVPNVVETKIPDVNEGYQKLEQESNNQGEDPKLDNSLILKGLRSFGI